MIRKYELTVIYAPVLKEEGLKSATKAVSDLAKKLGGQVLNVAVEGKTSLAYPIMKYTEGIYVFFQLELPADQGAKFELELKRQKGVIRQLFIRQDHRSAPTQTAPDQPTKPNN